MNKARLNEFFIRVLCIGSVLLYSASLSLMSAPQVIFQESIISKVLRLSNNSSSKFAIRSADDQFLATKLSYRVNALNGLFSLIGPLTQPVKLTIDYDHPTHILVGAVEVVIGNSAALASGQLEHALVKSWILQKASSEVLLNPVRVEISADVIIAIYEGGLHLQDIENHKTAEFSDPSSWIEDLYGTADLCESGWRPSELIPYCKGLDITKAASENSLYSARKVVGNLIWKDVSGKSVTARRKELQAIAMQLQTSKGPITTKSDVNEKLSGLAQLREQSQQLAHTIYPQLTGNLPMLNPLVAVLKNNILSSIHGMQLSVTDSAQVTNLIYDTCSTPTVETLLEKTSEKTEHILLIENCESKKIDYESFVSNGIAEFAQKNRDVKFAYLHRASLKLAKKLISNFDVIAALVYGPSSKDAKFLGLDQKIYRDDLDAYKVNGPIGAIEWFRAEISNASDSRS